VRLLAAGLLTLSTVGCHAAYSNETLLFLKALPRDLEMEVPDRGDSGQGLRAAQFGQHPAKFHAEAVAQATGINRQIEEIFQMIDHIVDNVDLSVDEDDVRVWGPFPVEDVLLALHVERVRTATIATFVQDGRAVEADEWYRYTLSAARDEGDWNGLLGGVSVPVEGTPYGTGLMWLDMRALGESEEPLVIAVPYDTRAGELAIDVAFDADHVPMMFEHDAVWLFRRNVEGDVGFGLSFRQNLEDTSEETLEDFRIGVRWHADLAGRADVRIDGGDLGPAFLRASECWDRRFLRTYFESNVPQFSRFVIGSPQDCAEGLRTSVFPD
jgi:hypothetical protein